MNEDNLSEPQPPRSRSVSPTGATPQPNSLRLHRSYETFQTVAGGIAVSESLSGLGAVDLRKYWEVIRHRWQIILGVFALVVTGVGVGTSLQTPMYRATGTIEIRRQAAEAVPMDALFELARISDQYLETQYEVLRSPALARRVVADLHLAEEFSPEEQSQLRSTEDPSASSASANFEQVVERVRRQIIVDPIRGSRLVKVSFDSEDPQLAAQVVNSLFENYIELRVEAGQAAVDQLSQQVEEIRARLAEAERKLQAYVRTSQLLVLDNGAGESENLVYERLRRLQQELTEAEAVRYERESLYNLVQREGPDFLDSDLLQSLSARIADLQSEYAKLRSSFTDEYPRMQQVRNQLDELEALRAAERRRIAAEIANSYSAALRRQDLLRSAFEEQKELLDRLAAGTAEYRILQRDVESHQQLYRDLQQKRKEGGIAAALAATEFGVVDPAVPRLQPISPSLGRNLQLAVLVGLVLGIGLAFLREYTDTTVRTVEEVDSFNNIPLLGMIPSTQSLAGNQHRIALSEAFGNLRTSVLYDIGASPPRSLLVTSSQPREGKTTVSTNLAVSLARLGRRVLLIDADIRRPTVHRALQLEAHCGLVDYLTGKAGLADWRVLVQRDVVPGLDVLPAGSPPADPTEVLSSEHMAELAREAQAEYDFVIFDSAALLINAADARILAQLTDGVVLVVRNGVTPRAVLKRAIKQGPALIGVVLNDLDARRFPAYYRDYSEQRGDAESPRALQKGSG